MKLSQIMPQQDWRTVLSLCPDFPLLIAAIGWHETNWGRLGAGKEGFILGYGYFPGSQVQERYRGLANQIRGAGAQLKRDIKLPVTFTNLLDFSVKSWQAGSEYVDRYNWACSVWNIYKGIVNDYEEEKTVGPYSDVSGGKWSTKAINYVYQAGIMMGFPDGTFKPEQPLTREQMAAILLQMSFRDGLFSDILPQVMPSVVLVHRGNALGSGACIAVKDGVSYCVTNAHVVGDVTSGALIKDDGQPNFEWELVAKDTGLDLAVIRSSRQLPVLPICTTLELGEPVAVIGAPLGQTESVTVGVVSKLKLPGEIIKIDAAINPGNSGGPVINGQGQLVAVVVAKVMDVTVEGFGYAIHPDVVANYIAKNIK